MKNVHPNAQAVEKIENLAKNQAKMTSPDGK
ncbi:hypothetical protein AM202_05389 [Actinobacillus minor 202]|uniref:Uncharacterized protein n=1 Tax=Actinobacillus minor 202 TaxID=591023 RepID=A0ABP2GR24_9PAST|nr:hypothetical protein AM202_05389 [Actinobacillus minor 202]